MMTTSSVPVLSPASPDELAAVLADVPGAVRFRGGGTKLGWGPVVDDPVLWLSTSGLDGVSEHNAGDMTAVVAAGTPFAHAQQAFAAHGQMLSLDPPDVGGATIGGVVAAADSGPLRYRYGAARDLVLGMRVALSDGTLARSGGKVIKNVAGYDLGKLFAGSYGTLGAIVEVSVRLHPLPLATCTVVGGSADPGALAAAASTLSHAPLEQDALDVHWLHARGSILSRFAGATARAQAEGAAALLAPLDVEVVEDDGALWDAQRTAQRSADCVVVRVSGVQTQLADVLRAAARVDAAVVGRAALGLSWLRLSERSAVDAVAAVDSLRASLAPSPCVVLDAPAEVRAALDPWDGIDAGVALLMGRVRERFDPRGVCAPGVFSR